MTIQGFSTLAQFDINGTLAFLLLALGFGFVIFVHELGHFLAAKAVGIKCSQFAIGFGQALLCYRKGIGWRVGTTEPETLRRAEEHLKRKGVEPAASGGEGEPSYTHLQIDRAVEELGLGETEYRLNWMPLGGYVKMLGQEDIGDQQTAASEDPRSFGRKPIWQRMIVISAGVVMNAIFAVVFFVAAFMYGVQFPPAVIGEVVSGSPAATTPATGNPDVTGLMPGDHVIKVNGEKPVDFVDIQVASALSKRGETVTLEVERPPGFGVEGGTFTFEIEPNDAGGKLRAIGVYPAVDRTLLEPGGNDRDRWEAMYGDSGLRPGMTLTHIDGQSIDGIHQLARALDRSSGKPIKLTFTDEAGQVVIEQQPKLALRPTGETDDPPPSLLGLVPPLKITMVSSGMPADGALREGDIVLRIDSVDLPSIAQALEIIPNASGAVAFEILRDGVRHTVSITPRKKKVGVVFGYATESNHVARVLKNSPFTPLELLTPARIEAVDGKPIENYTDLRRALSPTPGDVEVTYSLPLPDAEDRTATRSIRLSEEDCRVLAAAPWTLDLPPFRDLRTTQQADNVVEAAEMGFHKSWVLMIQTYQTLRALFGRTVPVSELRGPVGIVDAGTQFAKRGWTYLMFFLGVISVNLAVLNFLPIPILDGGLAVLLIMEKIRGKPVSVAVHNALTLIGLAMILSLVLFVTYNDIWRLINS